MFDFDEIARRALSPHWQTLPPEEQAEFVTLFRDLLERFYMAQIEACGGERISFVGESIEGDFATVRSNVVTRRGTAGIYAICVLRSASLRVRELSFATDDGGIWRHVQPRHRADRGRHEGSRVPNDCRRFAGQELSGCPGRVALRRGVRRVGVRA